MRNHPLSIKGVSSHKTKEDAVEKELCPGCTKPLEGSKEPLARIDLGKLGRQGWKQTGRWGTMHQGCFLIAIGDPAGIDFLSARN